MKVPELLYSNITVNYQKIKEHWSKSKHEKTAATEVTIQDMKSLKLLGTVEVFEEKIKKQLEEN